MRFDKYPPQSLIALLRKIILPLDKKRITIEKENQVISLAHYIMAAARPGSFKSPLMIATGVMYHRRFRSKSLVESLHSLGIAHFYSEILRYERSITMKFTITFKIQPNVDAKLVLEFYVCVGKVVLSAPLHA